MTGDTGVRGDEEQPPAAAPGAASTDARRRRRRRQGWTFVAILCLVLGVGLLATGHWMRWWTVGEGAKPAARPACPEQTTTSPRNVTVNVYNGTDRFGLARAVAVELQARGFRVATITNDTSGRPVSGVAAIRHGPISRVAAQTVSQQLTGQITFEDDGRASRTVDLVLGPGYRALKPRPEASKAIAPVPTPSGCVRVVGPATTPSATATG